MEAINITGRLMPVRVDCSVLVLEVAPADYSASHIARAVEDADVHLVDLLTFPAEEGLVRVTLRVRCDDPERVAAHLSRYGYRIVESYAAPEASDTVALDRLLGLQALINV